MKQQRAKGIMIFFLLMLVLSACGRENVQETEMVTSYEQDAVDREDMVESANKQFYAGIMKSIDENILNTDNFPKGMEFEYLTLDDYVERTYSFSQGPRAYSEGRAWGGEWCYQYVKGNSFGGFGCGMCCMANIYSTLSPYECSPWDMFEFATQATYYYPTRAGGAIGWEDLERTMEAAGLESNLHRKPGTYEYFQEVIKKSKSTIVLVSSRNDNTFWESTSGHYVNISLYQEDTDMVFLAEPGDLNKNRTWIPLRYVYDALKTVSNYHYLTVESYNEELNTWKHNGIDEVWNGK